MVGSTGLATDARSLDALRVQAGKDPQAAARQVGTQFEALFMQMLLKSMREASPKSKMFDGPGHDMYSGMLDQQWAQVLSGRPGGLAEQIAKQLSRHMQGQKAPEVAQISTSHAIPTSRMAGAASRNAASPHAFSPNALLTTSGTPLAQLGLPQASPVQREFVERMWQHAQAAQQATGVPAPFIVGQAALESGWGRSEIRHGDGRSAHNLFGIKAGSGWKGESVSVTTTEYVDGVARKQVERFRAYRSYEEGFRDWAQMMASRPHFAGTLQSTSSVQGYAQAMQRSGYATDPRYGEKLQRTIEQTLGARRPVI